MAATAKETAGLTRDLEGAKAAYGEGDTEASKAARDGKTGGQAGEESWQQKKGPLEEQPAEQRARMRRPERSCR